MSGDKIGPQHRARKAVLYVRQSSAHQVQHNRESQLLQYAMRDRLLVLGWSQIEVVDEDLGCSAAGGTTRAGFERMVAEATTINEMPLNSAICEPAPHAALQAGVNLVRGYAIATARSIARVEVSIDGGQSWQQAELEQHPEAPWSWTFWSAEINLGRGNHDLVVRAWDGSGEMQPDTIADVWNFPGYLCDAWHLVPVSVS